MSRSSQMSIPTMFAPCSAHVTACDRPWPRAAPVMKTTRPSSEPIPYPPVIDRQSAALGRAAIRARRGEMRHNGYYAASLESYNYFANLTDRLTNAPEGKPHARHPQRQFLPT